MFWDNAFELKEVCRSRPDWSGPADRWGLVGGGVLPAAAEALQAWSKTPPSYLCPQKKPECVFCWSGLLTAAQINAGCNSVPVCSLWHSPLHSKLPGSKKPGSWQLQRHRRGRERARILTDGRREFVQWRLQHGLIKYFSTLLWFEVFTWLSREFASPERSRAAEASGWGERGASERTWLHHGCH